MPLAIASISEWVAGLAVVAVVVAVLGLVGFAFLLRFFREAKTNLAAELGELMNQAKQATQVAVQQPLVVKPHEPCASLTQHEALSVQFDKLVEQRRNDVHGLHKKIEDGLDNVRQDIASEFKEVRSEAGAAREQIASLKTETNHQTIQLRALDSKMDQVLLRLPRPSQT